MKKIYLYILLLLLLVSNKMVAQPHYFRHYGVEEGLSNNAVMCSLQDHMGFMWFGTKDGLNRFDGYTFKVFRNLRDGKTNPGTNFIHALYEGRNHTMLVGTENGLYRYRKETEDFLLLPGTKDFYIDFILEDTARTTWFISGNRLCRYHPGADSVEVFEQNKYFVATSFCLTPEGQLWVGTANGTIQCYQPQTNSFYAIDLFSHSAPADRWIESLCATSGGKMLAGTPGTQIKVIEYNKGTYRDVTLACTRQSSLYSRRIIEARPGVFWIGTESGIISYNIQTGQCENLQKNHGDPYSLSDNAVYNFCRDREGGIWVGTYFGGANYLPNNALAFTKYFPRKGENSISGNVVREIQKDRLGNLWVGTEDAGLNKIDPATGNITRFTPDGSPTGLSFFNIHGLLATGNQLWIGTFHHGIDIMDIRTGKVVRRIKADGKSGLWHNFVYGFLETRNKEIFISTPNAVYRSLPSPGKVAVEENFPWGIFYTKMAEDSKGVIWSGSFGHGLFYFDPATGKKGNYRHVVNNAKSLVSNRVNYLFFDKKQTLWVATEAGLCRFNAADETFTTVGVPQGFPSDFIMSMEEDDDGNLWVSTTKGLARFNPATGQTQTYTSANGLLADQFNYNSVYKHSDGRIFFGSVKGLISFVPRKQQKPASAPPLYLTGFSVNNREVSVDTTGPLLQQSIAFTRELTLQHNQSNIGFAFAALGFTAPEMIHYRYQMKGSSKDWVDLDRNRQVAFAQLAPGSYTFIVNAFDENSEAITSEARIKITILPPWWKSRIAYVTYALCLLGLVFYLFNQYHQRMVEKNRRQLELLEVANEKELLKRELAKEKEIQQAKVDFFTNVAHEIRTPLTLIKVPLNKIIRKVGHVPEVSNSLKIVERNTNRLVDLTNQLLDFRQTEMNKYHLSFSHLNITEAVADACAAFKTLAEQNNLQLECQLPNYALYAYVDTDAFHKIIYNLFSNAVKYAGSTVHILLQHKLGNAFEVVVKNDGYLIPADMQEKIFEPFFRIQETENQTGTGIGLALARSLVQLHNGTLQMHPNTHGMNVFALTLPIQQAGSNIQASVSLPALSNPKNLQP